MRIALSPVVGLVLSILFLPGRVAVLAQQSSPTGIGAGTRPAAASQFIDPAGGLSVNQLVQLALERNADLLATRQRTVEAQGLLRQAGFRPNPVVESEFGSGSPTGSPGEREFSLGYGHVFELGRKRDRRLDVGRSGLDLARLEIVDRERTLRAELQERYIAAMAAIRNLETIAQQFDLTQQSLAVTQRRVSEGESPRVEQMVLQAEVGRLEADRLLLASEVQQEMLALRVVAGMDVLEPLVLQPEGDRPPTGITLEAALERALASRPDLAAARQEETRSAAETRLARAERVPDLAVRLRYTDSQTRFDLFGLTASGALAPLRDHDRVLTGGFSITLPLLSRNQGQIEAARARETAAALRRQHVTRSIEAEIRGAYGRYIAARQAVEVFSKTVIQPAQESVTVLRASYAAGEVRLFDVLAEQRRLIDTQKAYTEAIRQEALARVALERAIGVPLQ
jgi:cobalt-zinc-cadmium efflux system outer membrane protein